MPLYNNTETHEPTLRDAGIDPSPTQSSSRLVPRSRQDAARRHVWRWSTMALKQRIVVVDPKLRDEVHVRWRHGLDDPLQQRGVLALVVAKPSVERHLDVLVAVLVKSCFALPHVTAGLGQVSPLSSGHNGHIFGSWNQNLQRKS